MATSDSQNVPAHLGLILDGNRRWAKKNNKTTFHAHKLGYEKIKHIAEVAIDKGVEYVSVFAFSTENWNRSEGEVSYLMNLAYSVATNEVDELHKKNIRVRFLGSTDKLSKKLVEALKRAEEKTKNNTKGTVCVCFNYGGRQEIARAATMAMKSGADEISEKDIARNLYTPDVPDMDLVIRTSGEQRLSNFMLWRASYAELYFESKHWPDFEEEDLDRVLKDFSKRQRRHGK